MATAINQPHLNRVALVTGSSSGIGLALAKRLASEGASIALHGLSSAEEIEKTVNSIRTEYGVPVQHFAADFTDSASFQPMVERIRDGLGAVDILVNNAVCNTSARFWNSRLKSETRCCKKAGDALLTSPR